MVEFRTLDSVVNKYSRLGTFIDTELLLLLIVGKHYPNDLKDIGKYTEEDYNLIFNFLKKFNRFFITPYVVAEVSNLLKTKVKQHFSTLIEGCASLFKNFDEEQIKKDIVLNRKEAQWLGFPDASIIISSKKRNLLVLSEDGPLLRECEKLGIDGLDMSSLRAMG